MTPPKIIVTKLDAARAQIAEAITLWFRDGSPIAVHTLVAAAHEIVHAIYIQRGFVDLMFDSDNIKDEFRAYWVGRLRSTANFFKHADRDPDAVLEFDPDINELHILFTLVGLHRMKEVIPREGNYFARWLNVHRPNLLKRDLLSAFASPKVIENLRDLSKAEFYRICFELDGRTRGER